VQRKLRRYAGADAALLFPDARRNDTAGDA
jgi:hypothetical protein